jgi:hypothetical protein
MFIKLYKWDYETLKKLPEDWVNTADYETLIEVAKILHQFNWFKLADDVFKFLDKPGRKVATYEGLPFTAVDEIKEIIKEYEEDHATT